MCRLSLQIISFSTLDNGCLSIFLSVSQTKKNKKNTHGPSDIITLSIRVYLQMSSPCPKECYTTTGRILDEERMSPATQAPLRLLLQTRQMLLSFGFKHNRFQYTASRDYPKNCWTNHRHPPPTPHPRRVTSNFHFFFFFQL